MANPTGSTYLTANSGYTWMDGDVYEILQGNEQEGAGAGASFSALGVDNQPHQILLNKIQFVRTAQRADEVNIGALLAFMAGFTGLMGQQNGYLNIPYTDAERGPSKLLAQWGFVSFNGLTSTQMENALFTVNWPATFPTACVLAPAWYVTNSLTGVGAIVSSAIQMETGPLGRTQGQFFSDWGDLGGVIHVANPNTGALGLTGFQWFALGY